MKFHRSIEAVYDFLWEVAHDKYYLLWFLFPGLKRFVDNDQDAVAVDIPESDLIDPDDLMRWMEGRDEP